EQQLALERQFREGLKTPVIETKSPNRKSPDTSKDVDLGRELFTGEKRLVNGGPACIWCHTADGSGRLGGKLGPDLTKAYDRAGGAEALAAQLYKSHTEGSVVPGSEGRRTEGDGGRTPVSRATLAVYQQHAIRGDE